MVVSEVSSHRSEWCCHIHYLHTNLVIIMFRGQKITSVMCFFQSTALVPYHIILMVSFFKIIYIYSWKIVFDCFSSFIEKIMLVGYYTVNTAKLSEEDGMGQAVLSDSYDLVDACNSKT